MEDKLLAVVDGREVRESDLHSLMQNLGQNAGQFAGPEGKTHLLNEIIAQELLYSDALENNLEDEESFQTVLEQMKKSLLIQYTVNKIMTSVKVSDDEVKEYFDNNSDLFKTQETAVASHILVEDEETANNIIEEINSGLSFEDAAAKYSSCPSKERGGALGEFSRGQMVPEFEDATFSMNPGDISKPVETQFGYHIIKLDSINKAEDAKFEDVKEQAKQQCLLTKQNNIYLQKQADLKDKYKVEIVD